MKILGSTISITAMAVIVVAALFSFPPVAHADDESRWSVKTSLVLIDSDAPFLFDKPSGGRISAGGNAELGLSLAVEYRWSDLIGLELSARYARSPDVNDDTAANNDEIGEGPSFKPLIAGVNFHLVRTEALDLFVGPRVAYVNFGNFDLDVDGQRIAFAVDNEFAWGATAGLNYQIGESSWSVVAEATYLDVDMNITEQSTGIVVTSGFDPLMVDLGLSYRF